MTDITKLEEAIRRSGYRRAFIAEQLGLSIAGFYYKTHGQQEFKQSEIAKLADLLALTQDEIQEIFFCPDA